MLKVQWISHNAVGRRKPKTPPYLCCQHSDKYPPATNSLCGLGKSLHSSRVLSAHPPTTSTATLCLVSSLTNWDIYRHGGTSQGKKFHCMCKWGSVDSDMSVGRGVGCGLAVAAKLQEENLEPLRRTPPRLEENIWKDKADSVMGLRFGGGGKGAGTKGDSDLNPARSGALRAEGKERLG